MNYYILIIGVNIQYVISNKDVKVCKSLCSGSHLLLHYTLVNSLFPIAELWIEKCMQLTLTVCDGQLTGRSESVGRMLCWSWLESVLLKCQSAGRACFPPLLPGWEALMQKKSAESIMPALWNRKQIGYPIFIFYFFLLNYHLQ